MKILVTGAAGFIGFHTCLKLINEGHIVYGIDNINDYYDPTLKFQRLKVLGFSKVETNVFKKEVQSTKHKRLRFSRIDLVDSISLGDLFEKEQFEVVCNLAAQAGVRYSIENPKPYIDSNITGFLNIIEGCRNNNIKHLVYASSSSVYGENKKAPFETSDNVDHPISLYAASKKSNELMAHAYGHLYNFKTTGLRFFTVYGPWGRPDMAYYSFVQSISKDKAIEVFNNGKMERDFTYIDDIVDGIVRIIEKNIDNRAHYKIYNIGNNKTVKLSEFISTIENSLDKKANKIMLPNQLGDVPKTWADITPLKEDYGYNPTTDLSIGIPKFIDWYNKFIKII